MLILFIFIKNKKKTFLFFLSVYIYLYIYLKKKKKTIFFPIAFTLFVSVLVYSFFPPRILCPYASTSVFSTCTHTFYFSSFPGRLEKNDEVSQGTEIFIVLYFFIATLYILVP